MVLLFPTTSLFPSGAKPMVLPYETRVKWVSTNLHNVAAPAGIEPAANCLEGSCSIP